MGCCEGRNTEQRGAQGACSNKFQLKPCLTRSVASASFCNQDAVIIPDQSPEESAQEWQSPADILLQKAVDGDWNAVGSLAYRLDCIFSDKVNILGSKCRTVGSLALVLLTEQTNQDPVSTHGVVCSLLGHLVSILKVGAGDFRENALLLLQAYLPEASEHHINKLVELGVLRVLVRLLEVPTIQSTAAILCCQLCGDRFQVSQEFLQRGGFGPFLNSLRQNAKKKYVQLQILSCIYNFLADSALADVIKQKHDLDIANEIVKELAKEQKAERTTQYFRDINKLLKKIS